METTTPSMRTLLNSLTKRSASILRTKISHVIAHSRNTRKRCDDVHWRDTVECPKDTILDDNGRIRRMRKPVNYGIVRVVSIWSSCLIIGATLGHKCADLLEELEIFGRHDDDDLEFLLC